MLQIYPKLITDALATVRYPGTGKNLVEANMIEDDLRIDGMNVSFSIIFEKSTDFDHRVGGQSSRSCNPYIR